MKKPCSKATLIGLMAARGKHVKEYKRELDFVMGLIYKFQRNYSKNERLKSPQYNSMWQEALHLCDKIKRQNELVDNYRFVCFYN